MTGQGPKILANERLESGGLTSNGGITDCWYFLGGSASTMHCNWWKIISLQLNYQIDIFDRFYDIDTFCHNWS